MSISPLNQAELLKEHSSRIYFLFVDLVGDPFYACTAIRTYSFGGNDYLGIGEISSLGDFVNSSDIAARQLILTLSGVDAAITEPILSRVNYKNRTVTVYRGFFDSNEDLVDDPDVIWKGRADVGNVSHDVGTSVVQLTCEADLARLLRPNVSRYADEDHQLRYPGDTFYSFLSEMEKKDVLWGGVRVTPGMIGTIGGGGAGASGAGGGPGNVNNPGLVRP